MIDPVAPADRRAHILETAQVTVNRFDVQSLERRVVASFAQEDSNGVPVREDSPDEIRSEMAACTRDQ
jgi:hypothetical protein